MESLIRDEVASHGFQQNVQLLGHVERRELVKLYHACDVFVLPATEVEGDFEGFGIVLLEANAAGKPVVSTKVGGIPDVVEDGRSGVLVGAGAWDELAKAVIDLLSNDALRQQMGRYGRERARTQFDWPIVARRYVELMANL